MRMLAGVLPPDAGAITLEGIDVVAEPEAARPYLSYMPQRFGLYEDLTSMKISFSMQRCSRFPERCVARARRTCWTRRGWRHFAAGWPVNCRAG